MRGGQAVQTQDQEGRSVSFMVEVTGDGVVMWQQVAGERVGYRGVFRAWEAAELGAALLRASGAVSYGCRD